jgi:hypothetical protein
MKRNPTAARNPKTEDASTPSRSILECGGKRSATPLWLRRQPHAPATSWQIGTGPRLESQSAVAAGALPAHSKTWRLRLASFCILLSAFCFRAWGQYTIDWSTIDGGGGTSTGGVYTVAGTIGQPDAGVMSGGNYTLQGGFWGVLAAVQTPGAPWLSITKTATNTVVLSWPLPDTGSKLQISSDLAATPPVWTEIPPPYSTNTTHTLWVVPVTAGNQFYRLHKP